MSYSPNTWSTGDTITAAKLNNLEEGAQKTEVFVVHVTVTPGPYEEGNATMDRTVSEISTAMTAGIPVMAISNLGSGAELICMPVGFNSGSYYGYMHTVYSSGIYEYKLVISSNGTVSFYMTNSSFT